MCVTKKSYAETYSNLNRFTFAALLITFMHWFMVSIFIFVDESDGCLTTKATPWTSTKVKSTSIWLKAKMIKLLF